MYFITNLKNLYNGLKNSYPTAKSVYTDMPQLKDFCINLKKYSKEFDKIFDSKIKLSSIFFDDNYKKFIKHCNLYMEIPYLKEIKDIPKYERNYKENQKLTDSYRKIVAISEADMKRFERLLKEAQNNSTEEQVRKNPKELPLTVNYGSQALINKEHNTEKYKAKFDKAKEEYEEKKKARFLCSKNCQT